MHHHHLTTWFLILFTLLQTAQADQEFAKSCHEYCLKCDGNRKNYKTPNLTMGDALEVSLQVMANGALPQAHIILLGPDSDTSISVNQENVTMMVAGEKLHQKLSLSSSHPAFSWVTLVLAPVSQDTLLVYTPTDRLNAITANTSQPSLVYVSAKDETRVTFNCLSGCLVRTNSSALVGGEVELQPPFIMYLKPIPSQHPITPVLTLTPSQSPNTTVNVSTLTLDMWHRLKILVAENEQEQKEVRSHEGEVQIWVNNDNYTLTRLRGFKWTLHCAPEGFIDAVASSGNNSEGTAASTPTSKNGEGTGPEAGDSNTSEQKTGGAGAGQVTAWVMAGLALFLVMVLALALCTKTARYSQPSHVQDSQPSVGIIFSKGAAREPEEDSEPESPNELKVPAYRNSYSYRYPVNDYRVVEAQEG